MIGTGVHRGGGGDYDEYLYYHTNSCKFDINYTKIVYKILLSLNPFKMTVTSSPFSISSIQIYLVGGRI